MPPINFNVYYITAFEEQFMYTTYTLTNQPYLSLSQAYFSFIQLDDVKRHGVWDQMAKAVGVPRDKLYKFFRFTWSKQFYRSLDDCRVELKSDIMYELQFVYQRDGAHQQVWKKIWPRWQHFGLHYEAADQFCRNTVNFYFKNNGPNQRDYESRFRQTFYQLNIQKASEFEHPTMMGSIVEERKSVENDSFTEDSVIGIRRKGCGKASNTFMLSEGYDIGNFDDWPSDMCNEDGWNC